MLGQIFTITGMNIRNLPSRWSSSVVAMAGIAGVVGVLVAVLSIAEGFRATLDRAGSDDTVIVLRGGATSELSSGLAQQEVRIIAEAPGVVQNEGRAVASAELYVIIDVAKRSTGTDANVPLRGVEPGAFQVREGLRIVEGRNFEPGRNEIIVGRGAARQFAGLEVGSRLVRGTDSWNIVGLFEDGGSVSESELWCDVRLLQAAYKRGSTFQSVRAQLASPGDLQRFKDALTTDPRLNNPSVFTERAYYAEQSQILTQIIGTLGWALAALMGIGAVFAAINTMYTAVAARVREIATLRALGFGSVPVVVSVIVEALILGFAGGVVGAILAFVAFNGFQTSTLNWQSFSQVTFAFAVTPRLMVVGVIVALVLGLLGGILPGIRAARLPVATALREL